MHRSSRGTRSTAVNYKHWRLQRIVNTINWIDPPEGQKLCVDGTRKSVLTASEDTIQAVNTANGYIAYEIVTETVRNVVRNQFDCPTVLGGRLENQPTGDTDCFGSHWDHVSILCTVIELMWVDVFFADNRCLFY